MIKKVKEILEKFIPVVEAHYNSHFSTPIWEVDIVRDKLAQQICQLFEPKGDRDGLLTDKEILYYHSGEHFADAVAMDNACGPRIPYVSEKERELCVAGGNIAGAQRDLTASIKDVECQGKVEEAWIGGIRAGQGLTKQERPGCLFKHNGVSLADEMFRDWQALKKKEGVK